MVTVKLFRSNKGQTVRLPSSMELPASVSEVAIIAVGETRVLAPAGVSWDTWFEEPVVSHDFDRGQPAEQRHSG